MAAVQLRLFGPAREAAGTSEASMEAETLPQLLDEASARYGEAFALVLSGCRVWVNGDEPGPDQALAAGDEVAVLPPVSGG